MWPFLWAGPLELLAVLFMLASELGWIPALAGAAALLVLVPFQVRSDLFSIIAPPQRLRPCGGSITAARATPFATSTRQLHRMST